MGPGFFEKGRKKDEVMKKHPDVKEKNIWNQIFLIEFIQNSGICNQLKQESDSKNNERPFPVKNNTSDNQSRVEQKLRDGKQT